MYINNIEFHTFIYINQWLAYTITKEYKREFKEGYKYQEPNWIHQSLQDSEKDKGAQVFQVGAYLKTQEPAISSHKTFSTV